MAATAASRAGRSTLLIERYGFLGGAGTMGGLSTFCGLHARVDGEDVRVIRGFADELLDRLEALDGLNPPHLSVDNRIMAQAFDISAYKMAADDLVLAGGAELLFHASVQGVVLGESGHIDAVVVESKSGAGVVRGRFFIDALRRRGRRGLGGRALRALAASAVPVAHVPHQRRGLRRGRRRVEDDPRA